LIVTVTDAVPGLVMGDPHRFRQVLLNLLGNAVKFTRKGVIGLKLDSKLTESGHCCLTVSIKDSGIGIAQDQQDKIFKPFIQSEDDITNRYGGTGLGLAISKNIAHKMQGDIWVESIKGEGSTFYFTSCFKIGENKKVDRVQPVLLRGKRVLVCSVSESIHEILYHELSRCEMDITSIFLQNKNQFLKDYPDFDIGIVDFGNSDKQTINDLIEKHIPDSIFKAGFDFLACSIPASGIAELFKNAGFKGFLPKPVSRRKLIDMIAYVIGIKNTKIREKNEDALIVTSHLLNENKKHSVSILLVEDNPVNQKMTKLMLSKAGYAVDIAVDGQDAVYKYTSAPGSYDLILMDINMPKMNGFEATKAIRGFEMKNKSLKRIPILALTANVLDDFKRKCVDAQMDDFLTKPIKRDVVFTSIRKWVNAQKS
ncbi:MAG: response regulator, partial [Proteobacteria bacterium]|nr:response regulator [Pseudomonadota bacterium]